MKFKHNVVSNLSFHEPVKSLFGECCAHGAFTWMTLMLTILVVFSEDFLLIYCCFFLHIHNLWECCLHFHISRDVSQIFHVLVFSPFSWEKLGVSSSLLLSFLYSTQLFFQIDKNAISVCSLNLARFVAYANFIEFDLFIHIFVKGSSIPELIILSFNELQKFSRLDTSILRWISMWSNLPTLVGNGFFDTEFLCWYFLNYSI